MTGRIEMGHYIALCALIVFAGFGIHRLGKVFLMWNELALAKAHTAIDESGLLEWAEGFEKRISLLNLAAFLAASLGVVGAFLGNKILSWSFGQIIMVAVASGMIALCAYGYDRLYSVFERTVGISAETASQEVAGNYS